ncbi:MAG: phosphoenolpyruvate--protein phosphotransferase [Deltaproteobacteria bacterium]|nr:phosphoenolpyruvate--protein phosphotransferase [Candidatus Anaeroferrophillus wilburensis]MBN2889469.1 phosphoenolpyruvate--protein phosphotransferase [Deltaproteobacteria bacterium]
MKGIGVSPGIVVGRAFLLDRDKLKPAMEKIASEQVQGEIDRFLDAIAAARRELMESHDKALKNSSTNNGSKDHLYLFDVHLMMMDDKMITDETAKLIREKKINAEWALTLNVEKIRKIFDRMDDPYMRERQADISHVAERILRQLMKSDYDSIEKISNDVILIAHDLSPADTMQLNLGKVKAFVTDLGGRTSHTAIVARSLEIPAVVGLERATEMINGGNRLIVDGIDGRIIVSPTLEQVRHYREKAEKYLFFQRQLLENRELAPQTKDGFAIELAANIENPEEAESAISHGAGAIGLYRTEFLYLNRDDLPKEEEHYITYKRVLQMVPDQEVTIRTLDLGYDKISRHRFHEDTINPAMGLRGIRLCFKQKEIFRDQLRGILRASQHGKVKILFPMISGMRDLRQAKEILADVKDELRRKGIAFDDNIPIGVMIEIPSAAVVADLLAREVDFFSIGTNDLIQYTLAVDRVNEHVSCFYEPLHPAILRLLQNTIEAAHGNGIPVSVCGEMAGEPLYTLVLLGLGLDQLSMNPLSIPYIKKIMRDSTYEEAKEIVKECLTFTVATDVENFVEEQMRHRFTDDFLMKL